MTALESSYWPADETYPVLDLTAGDLLRQCVADSGDVTALVEVALPGSPALTGASSIERRWTYRELLDDAVRCAGYLASRFRPGERIVVWAPNVPEWVIAQYGAALAGLVLVTANPAMRAEELRYVLEQSQCAALLYVSTFRGSDMAAIAEAAVDPLERKPVLIGMDDWADAVRTWPADVDLPSVAAGDAAQIQYTSGTTGRPKGALLHHRGLVTNAQYIGLRSGAVRGGDVVSAMPLFHTAGCGMTILGTAHLRGTVHLLQMFEPGLMLDVIERAPRPLVYGVPTMFIAMLDHPTIDRRDLSRCIVAVSGGSAVPAPVARRIEDRFGVVLSTVYGQTELSPIVTQTGPDDSVEDRIHTAGRPLWNVEVKIADPASGQALDVGGQGEICARGYQRMLGYYNMPERTAETIDADGWVHTGDLGTMDARGYLTVTGRLKDMIIRGGENIYPREIEELLFAHPAIAQVSVVGVPDERWGETVAAVVQLRGGAAVTAAELHAYCREHLAPHKTPTAWYVTDAYPMTGSGKLQKFRLTELIEEGGYRPLG
ncbi:AMP-binding protein [Cumulibacter manganitolerans]|uniref:AMP-binding protein n=1 Tax=Cumulibacter manganitolerans TaxID=1884992 RepID=UPI0012968A23|nr:AMP-binding protein [Cumulibacter manganitolerans]